jgi:electron transfer flavoprotein alpha subunit
MNIYVCVKQVPASNETLLDPVTHTIIREGTQSILNPFDAYAVEEAVRIKARCGGMVTAFTMGIPSAEGTLRRVIAVGADDAVLLTDKAFAGSDTLATARTLAASVQKRGLPELILCGRMATDGDTAQVGPMLAECLDIPHVSDVAEIEDVNETACVVRKMTDDGYVRLRVKLPALLTVLKEINIPRLPSVSGVLRGEKAEVARMNREDTGIDAGKTGLTGSATRVIRTERPVVTRETVWIEGTAKEQAEKLKKYLDRIIGDPSTLAPGCRPFSTEKEPLALSPGVSNLGMTRDGDSSTALRSVQDDRKARMAPGGVWVYCEQGPDGIRPVAYELLGQAARLAGEMRQTVTAVLVGGTEEAAASLTACGADQVLLAEIPPEELPDERVHTAALEKLVGKYRPAVLLLGATAFGRSLAPRLAARLETGLTADCTGLEIDPETGLLRQTRPAFGGNLMATIVCPDRTPQMATVRPKVFQRIGGLSDRPPIPLRIQPDTMYIFPEKIETSERCFEFLERIPAADEIDIGTADVLISIGQGIGGAENIAMAEELTRRLGGAISSSRPPVDSGTMPYARQVGQTGKTVSPKLYLALGISGAIQHMAGVAAKTIAAVNTDPDAPIFSYADYAVRCDCGAFLRAMLEKN